MAQLLLLCVTGVLAVVVCIKLGVLSSSVVVEQGLDGPPYLQIWGGFGVLMATVAVLQAVPTALAAWGLWHGRPWRQAAAIATALLSVLQGPIGMVFGLGTLVFVFLAHKAVTRDPVSCGAPGRPAPVPRAG